MTSTRQQRPCLGSLVSCMLGNVANKHSHRCRAAASHIRNIFSKLARFKNNKHGAATSSQPQRGGGGVKPILLHDANRHFCR